MTTPSDAHIERALDLPSGTLRRGRQQGQDPDLRALLRIIEVFPWLLDVADANYDQAAASSILLAQGAETAVRRAAGPVPAADIRRLIDLAWDRSVFQDADGDVLKRVEQWLQEVAPAAPPAPTGSPAQLSPLDLDIAGPDEDFQEEPDLGPARVVDKAPNRPGIVHLWTDGACSGNPGPMGLGVVVVDPLAQSPRREVSEFLGKGTNNIAELTAIERALRETDPERPAVIYTDSAYAIGVLARGWTASANQELVARIRDRIARHREVYFVKVKGHCGIADNERCDALARLAVSRGR